MEWNGGWGEVLNSFLLSSTYFTEGRMDLHREAIEPEKNRRVKVNAVIIFHTL